MIGIVGYGASIPKRRIKVEEISKVWGTKAENFKRGLLLQEKSVPAPDQDTISMSVDASRNALLRAGIDPKFLEAVYVGSESHPYAVKPSGTVVAEAIGATPEVHCADFEFACKAGTEAMFVTLALVKSGWMKYALAVGADTSQGRPGDALEYTASAGAAAFIMGRNDVIDKHDIIAEIEHTYSYMTDTPDFWRREFQFYPEHAGRFTGEPAYFKHVLSAATGIMEKANLAPEDFAHAVFHQPNGKFPLRAGKKLGFKTQQLEAGLLCPSIGNTYSGSSPLGLTAILDIAQPGDRILMVSYGSGSGSDAFIWKITRHIRDVQTLAPKTADMITRDRIHVDYGTYAKYRKKIKK
ncbi:MAG: hydroxymethylglutaryl-CoA synthase [Calditrichaeota bacterium]|nr:MAG: hydroxymethylglutaryl-CoA synthase [Calditrichota bacterium]